MVCGKIGSKRDIEIQTPTMSATNSSGTMHCMPLFEAPQRKIERLIVLRGKRKCTMYHMLKETIQATSAHSLTSWRITK